MNTEKQKDNQKTTSIEWKIIKLQGGIILSLIITIIIMFSLQIYKDLQYDYIKTEETVIESNDEGNANYLKGTGDIQNGKNYGNDNKNQD